MTKANTSQHLFSPDMPADLAAYGVPTQKRAFDFIFGIFLLVLLLPVIAAIALAVKLDGGAAFFGHMRVGRDGRLFKCWKFRSMVPNSADVLAKLLETDPDARAEWDASRKLRADPRVTRIGRVLRQTSLDELPQLFNVLGGDMSFVGPRPVVQQELEDFYGREGSQCYRSVQPGITGLWQVSGRSDTDYPTRVALDIQYVRNRSFRSDLSILTRTVGVVALRRGAR